LNSNVSVIVAVIGAPRDPSLAAAGAVALQGELGLDGAELPAGHPAAGKGPVKGKPAAYVCRGQTCSLPITDPEALGKVLQF
jgi:uncharacterized protein YyaL (SSP411 family)